MLLALPVTVSRSRANEGAQDFEALSGVWTGSFSILQRGQCKIDGSGRSSHRVQFRMQVDADGSFKAGVSPASAEAPTKLSWNGRIASDLTLTMVETVHTSCGEREHEYEIDYAGEISKRDEELRLILAGDDAACPESKCIFKRQYELEKK